MHESGLIRTSVAHYMFGFFCVRCLVIPEFWNNIEEGKRSYYWSLFIRFANLMRDVETAQLDEYNKLSADAKEALRLSRRPSLALWRRQPQLRF
jgi:hypothetical protein